MQVLHLGCIAAIGDQGVLHLGDGGNERFAVSFRSLFRCGFLGAYRGSQGSAPEQGLEQIPSQGPSVVVFPEELAEISAAAGKGARQAEARVQIRYGYAHVGHGRVQVRLSGDNVGPAPQEFGGEAYRNGGRFLKDGSFGQRQFYTGIICSQQHGELVFRGGHLCFQLRDAAFRGGDGGGGLLHIQTGGEFRFVAFFRNGEGAALDFQLFPGDAELFAGGNPVKVGRGDVRQQGCAHGSCGSFCGHEGGAGGLDGTPVAAKEVQLPGGGRSQGEVLGSGAAKTSVRGQAPPGAGVCGGKQGCLGDAELFPGLPDAEQSHLHVRIVVEGGGDQAVELGVSKDIPPGTQIFVRTVGGPVRLPRGGEVIGRRPEIRAYHAGAKETGGQKGEMFERG